MKISIIYIRQDGTYCCVVPRDIGFYFKKVKIKHIDKIDGDGEVFEEDFLIIEDVREEIYWFRDDLYFSLERKAFFTWQEVYSQYHDYSFDCQNDSDYDSDYEDNPYYNDDLDMDQQSEEFWDSI